MLPYKSCMHDYVKNYMKQNAARLITDMPQIYKYIYIFLNHVIIYLYIMP